VHDIFIILKEKKLPTRPLYPAKMSFKKEKVIKTSQKLNQKTSQKLNEVFPPNLTYKKC
jgi:hypothetical protein